MIVFLVPMRCLLLPMLGKMGRRMDTLPEATGRIIGRFGVTTMFVTVGIKWKIWLRVLPLLSVAWLSP